MGRSLLIVARLAALCTLAVTAAGQTQEQVTPSQNIISAPPLIQPADALTSPAPSAEITETTIDPASLLPDLPSVPSTKASLIGGTIEKLDRVRDQITVRIFGGGKMTIAYDTRTHIFHNGTTASTSELRQGDRVYVETILDGSTVFARSIQLKTSGTAGESQGIVTSYQGDKGELQIRDSLSPQPIKIRISSQTRVLSGGNSISANQLGEGMLVAVKFGPRQDDSDVAQEIKILAVRGASFTFAGRVAAIDLRLGLLVIDSATDHKTYEISFDPSTLQPGDDLRPSADVTVLTRFEGDRYVARSVTVNSQSQR